MLLLENIVKERVDENIGNPMIFEVCDALREHIADMNQLILDKLFDNNKKDSITTGLSKGQKISMDGPTSFTPVNKETFSKWCEVYLEKLNKIMEERKTDKDLKPTGR